MTCQLPSGTCICRPDSRDQHTVEIIGFFSGQLGETIVILGVALCYLNCVIKLSS